MKDSNSTKSNFWSKFKRKAKSLLILFWSMFKIGLFTFGGGYAMIHLLENEFVSKKKWLDNDEFFDLVTIAESTPGPVAINCSTYIGYKTEKFLGAFIATTAMCIPSFVIIFVISLFFDAFLANQYIAAAFKGIQVCAVFLILCAGIKMAKKIKISIFNIALFIATFAAMVLVSIFNAKFSSIFYILISGGIGLFIYSIKYINDKTKKAKANANIGSDTLIENNEENKYQTSIGSDAEKTIEVNTSIENTTDNNDDEIDIKEMDDTSLNENNDLGGAK